MIAVSVGYGVAADGSGNVTLTGHFAGTADLGGGNVTSKGGSDIYLVKLGP